MRAKLFLLLAVLGWGTCGVFQKLAIKTMIAPAVQLLSSSVSICVITCYYLISLNSSQIHWNSRGMTFAACAAICSTVGSISFVLLLKTKDISSIIGYAACYPLVTFMLAILFLGETFYPQRLIGIIIVLVGIALIGR